MHAIKISKAHHNMMQKQIREQFMLSESVLEAIGEIPRHDFVPEAYRGTAYAEMNIPLAHGEMMMTPNEEARMLGSLNILPSDKVLEVGTGSAYVTALLAKLGHSVISLDIYEDFVSSAVKKLKTHKLHNTKVINADGANGYAPSQPFDVICVTGGLHYVNETLLKQLRPGGRIFAIIGEQPAMTATVFKKDGQWQQTPLFETQISYLKNIPAPEVFKF
jgi:protein-L-isoaspartate(D-aspartate) O-methyltransferase